jgi:hypothetical protein
MKTGEHLFQALITVFFRSEAQTFFPYLSITTIIYRESAAPVQKNHQGAI